MKYSYRKKKEESKGLKSIIHKKVKNKVEGYKSKKISSKTNSSANKFQTNLTSITGKGFIKLK